MADISKINVNSTDYNVKDATARSGLNDKLDIAKLKAGTNIRITDYPSPLSPVPDGNLYINSKAPRVFYRISNDDITSTDITNIAEKGISFSQTGASTGNMQLTISGNADDLASIRITGTTNNTGSTISAGKFFYLNNALVLAIEDIVNSATLTENTDYVVITAGSLNSLGLLPTVTPTASDKLLVVQSQGQGLTTIGDFKSDKMDKANPTGTGSLSLNRKANTTIGTNSVAEGESATASGSYSHAEGYGCTASGNYASHAEGYQTTASGYQAHSEGRGTTASGETSHSEGRGTTASGGYGSHAEGSNTTASGDYGSHAEGATTTASGDASHCEGSYTIAQRLNNHVFGRYNIADTGGTDTTTKGTYIEIVGKGTADNARSNARTLDWSGNEVLAGGLKIKALYDVLSTQTTILNNTNDMNDIKTQGFYYLQAGVANSPSDWSWCIVIGGSGVLQLIITANTIFMRAFTGSPLAWTAWRCVDTTLVPT